MNTSNGDNVIGNSNLPCINVQTEGSFNTLITLQKQTDIESSISINDEIIYEKNISEYISYNHNAAEVINHKFYDNGKNYSIQNKKRMSHQFIIPM